MAKGVSTGQWILLITIPAVLLAALVYGGYKMGEQTEKDVRAFCEDFNRRRVPLEQLREHANKFKIRSLYVRDTRNNELVAPRGAYQIARGKAVATKGAMGIFKTTCTIHISGGQVSRARVH